MPSKTKSPLTAVLLLTSAACIHCTLLPAHAQLLARWLPYTHPTARAVRPWVCCRQGHVNLPCACAAPAELQRPEEALWGRLPRGPSLGQGVFPVRQVRGGGLQGARRAGCRRGAKTLGAVCVGAHAVCQARCAGVVFGS